MAATPSRQKSAADFFVSSVPTLPDASQRYVLYAGDLPARPGTDAALYFQLHRARHPLSPRRLVIWFNGGPGCSSFDGVMMEIGAWRTQMDATLQWSPEGGGWNEYADVLFLDQPVGTGFSYAPSDGYVSSLAQAAKEVRYFLERFVEVFPEYRAGRGVETYLAGESFAGQYIPYTAQALTDPKQQRGPVQLQGIAIGNGFLDPRAQYGSEIDYLTKRGLWSEGGAEHLAAQELFAACRQALDRVDGNPRLVDPCDNFLSELVSQKSERDQVTNGRCINIYDVRLDDSYPSCGMNWPPNIKATYAYLRRPDVRAAFHVDNQRKPEAWVECNGRVGRALQTGSVEPASVTLLPHLLERGLRVLIFAGDQDLICNHLGLERMLDRLTWHGGTGFSQPAEKAGDPWYVGGRPAGLWHSERNLTYVKVFNASHMVPFDLPVVSHDMMLRFMNASLVGAAGALGQVPSRIGNNDAWVWFTNSTKSPSLAESKSAQEAIQEAQTEAYYRTGRVALMAVLLLVGVGLYLIVRHRRRSCSEFRAVPTEGLPSGISDVELERLVEQQEDDTLPEGHSGLGRNP